MDKPDDEHVLVLAFLAFGFALMAFLAGMFANYPWSFIAVLPSAYIMGRSLHIIEREGR